MHDQKIYGDLNLHFIIRINVATARKQWIFYKQWWE